MTADILAERTEFSQRLQATLRKGKPSETGMGLHKEMREGEGTSRPAGPHTSICLIFPTFQTPNTGDGGGARAPSAKAPGAQRPNPLGALLLYSVSLKPQTSGNSYSDHVYFSREHDILRIFPEHLLCGLVLHWGQGALKVSQIWEGRGP